MFKDIEQILLEKDLEKVTGGFLELLINEMDLIKEDLAMSAIVGAIIGVIKGAAIEGPVGVVIYGVKWTVIGTITSVVYEIVPRMLFP